MLSKKIIIAAPTGIHARPAGELVNLVKTFTDSKVSISTPVKTVNAASMLSVLSLGLKCGTEIELKVDGGDETTVLEKLSSFIEGIRE